MPSKVSSAARILREEGPTELLRSAKGELFPPRDRLREIQGSAADLYDCFIFYNELELLRIRLHELDDVVDTFVIVEATETYQGDEKPLYFAENREEFAAFEDRIVHHVVEYPDDLEGAWEREYYLRDAIQAALKAETDVSIHDEVIVSDADEIPSSAAVRRALSPGGGVTVFSQSLHYYYYNYVLRGNSRWLGPVMLRYGRFTSAQDVRNRYTQHKEDPGAVPPAVYFVLLELLLSVGNRTRVRIVEDGGWHFSYLGDVEYILDKIETFAHTELNEEEYKDPEAIERAMLRGEDLFGQGMSFECVELDERFPSYLRAHRDEFAHNVLADVSTGGASR